jgi:hypothetical protein
MRRAVLAATTIVFAVVGTRLSAPHDRKASEPFAYMPPEGFTAADEGASEGDKQWSHPPKGALGIAPRVHLTTSKTGGTVEAADLARIAEGMPSVLEPNGVTWTDVRRETRTRPDGARVGLIEGECTRKVEETVFGGPPVKVRYRRLLLVFPTDDGSALITAVYGKDEVSTWEPAFEATIGAARGVAVRVPPPPLWMILAWGGAGLVLGWLALLLVARREPAAPAARNADADADAKRDEA